MTPRPALFATPETVSAVARAPGVAILIGGYDGSGNYGDLAQLDAALDLLAPLEPGVLLLPVLERSLLASHGALSDSLLHRSMPALFFDLEEGDGDGLLPVVAPASLTFASCYLYGGGYLNPAWGERKLAMLRAADSLLTAGGANEICRISSGLQVDAGFLAGLPDADAELLRSFELLGARDGVSVDALAALGSGATVTDTSDDVVGLLRRLPLPDAAPVVDGRLHVNLQIAEHGWVTDRPATIAGFLAELCAELGRNASLPVSARPLIAYLDERVDERPAIGRLAEACAARGVELAEPLVLRPATLAKAIPEIRRASLTFSCSYHVALTSLLLEVPAALLGDNAYYEQKAAGLVAAFDLPPCFALSSHADPVASAREIGATVLNREQGAALRRDLASAAARVRERRANAEVELLSRIGAFQSARLAELGERLRERSAEPAQLLAQLARSTPNGAAPDTPAPVEAVAAPEQPAEDGSRELLTEVLRSRSWRLTAPLRRVQALLHRRR